MKDNIVVDELVFGPATMPATAIVGNEYSNLNDFDTYEVTYVYGGNASTKVYQVKKEASAAHNILSRLVDETGIDLTKLASISIKKKN